MRPLHISAVFVSFVGLFTKPGLASNPCDGTVVDIGGTSGTISSPNYPIMYLNNLNCVWRIETPNNTRIVLRFDESFAVEWSDITCNYDYLRVGEPYVTWCGLLAPKSYLSATNILMVWFVTDESAALQGFSFNWNVIDPSTIIPAPVYKLVTGDQGQISSPNYPSNYSAFSNYTWEVHVSEGKNILIEFAPIFDMEQSKGCLYDYLAISETNAPLSRDQEFHLCHFHEPKLFYTDTIYIRFVSDSINNGAGFSLNYSAIAEPMTCNGVTQQNGTTGVIESPYYPNKYPGGLNCTWHVTAPENTVIAVRFNSNYSLVSSTGCMQEYLQLFDGPDSSYEKIQRDFCEPWAPRAFVTTSNTLTARFVSSDWADFTHIGFHITWTAEGKCKSDEFTCWDGTCIHESGKCNTTLDCPNDIADEASCPNNDSVQCGNSEAEPNFKWHSRIVGGYEAVKGSWPWQGNLKIVTNGNPAFMCGCVLFSHSWVLTAAHCIFPGVESTFVTFGDHDMAIEDGDEQHVTVDRIFVHPQYNWTDEIGFIYGYDIALLHLESSVNYTKWVKPVCLPEYEVMDGDQVVLTGWGRMKFGGDISRVLRQVVSTIVSREKCSELANIPNLSDSIICAGLPFGGASTCNGDSGGPLVAQQNGSWVIAGITSFGSFCGQNIIPGSYTNVHNLLPWIDDVMKIGMTEIHTMQRIINAKTAESGIISSTNYGESNYLQGQRIMWFIMAEKGKLIQIRFNKTFRIHQTSTGKPCAGDYLLIYDGSATSSRKYGDKKLCGYKAPLDMESATNAVIVEFFSDYDFEDVGFSLSWTVVDGCGSNEFRCWDQTCLDISKKCDGTQNCPSNVDEFECATASPGSTECGKTEIAPEFPFSPLIIGGNNVEKGSWPWQVAVYVKAVGSFSFSCGGTLVSDSWVLTAANCLVGSSYRVVIGGYNRSLSGENTIQVDMAFQYSGQTESVGRVSNFAMLKLATPVDFTSKWYKPICLPTNDTMYPPVGSTCVVTGWGKTGPNRRNTNPDILQQLPINILSDEDCYGGHPTLICAGHADRDTGMCLEDFGGPLVCEKDGKWIQYGIAFSYLINCGHRSLYERVSLHTDTILDIINNLKVCKELEIIEGVTTGEILPPIINGQYWESISCSWLIRGPPNTLININFEFFETEDCEFGTSDFVDIYDGNSTSARKVFDDTLCGSLENLRGFESSTNELFITFVSDPSTTAKGFKIHFSVVEDCNLNQFRCWNGTCVDKSLQCDGKSDCYDQSDEKECAITYGQCGKQKIVPEFLWHARIAGGHFAKNGSWPFVVQIIEDIWWENFICGGTILNERWILTLASSVESRFVEDLKVIVGASELMPDDAPRYQVELVMFPSQFSLDYIGAVGILKLKTSISFSATVQPACLSLPNVSMEPQPGEHCVALGWGASFVQQGTTGPLRQTLVPILAESICANKRTSGDSNRTFCSGDESGGTGTCEYDEGGPVMCFRDNVWVQSGVVTKSNSCGKLGVFEFYTRVSAYVNWIQKTMNMTLPTHTDDTISTTIPGPGVTTSTMTPTSSTPSTDNTSTTTAHTGMTVFGSTTSSTASTDNTSTTTAHTGMTIFGSTTSSTASTDNTSTTTAHTGMTVFGSTMATESTPSSDATSTSTVSSAETTGFAITQTVTETTSGAASVIPLPAVLITAFAMVFQRVNIC